MLRITALSSVLAAWLLLSLPAAAGEVVNQVILRVNDRITTLYDYLDRRAGVRQEILRNEQLSPEDRERLLAELPQRVMRDIFQELLLESRADQLEIFVSQDEIDEEIQGMMKRNEITSQEQLVQALQSFGMDMEKFRQQFETEIRLQKVVGQEVRSQVTVEEDELRRVYRANLDAFTLPEQRNAREIIILEESSLSPEERESLAQETVGRLRAGGSLEAIAAELSDRQVASGVIDLGWVTSSEIDPSLQAPLWELSADAERWTLLRESRAIATYVRDEGVDLVHTAASFDTWVSESSAATSPPNLSASAGKAFDTPRMRVSQSTRRVRRPDRAMERARQMEFVVLPSAGTADVMATTWLRSFGLAN